MLDGAAQRIIGPLLDRAGRRLASAGIGADAVTVAGLILAIAAAAAISSGWFLAGLVLILASRLADGLDGAVARAGRKTDFGGYIDIVFDFAYYGAIPFAFILADIEANAAAGAFLLLSFYINGASFLAYAALAQKRGMETSARGEKSLYFTTGLAEATETFAVFVAMCVFPAWFPVLAWGFGAICLYTAGARILLARRAF
jgi:phosphatidylglycerophosphate synthase